MAAPVVPWVGEPRIQQWLAVARLPPRVGQRPLAAATEQDRTSKSVCLWTPYGPHIRNPVSENRTIR